MGSLVAFIGLFGDEFEAGAMLGFARVVLLAGAVLGEAGLAWFDDLAAVFFLTGPGGVEGSVGADFVGADFRAELIGDDDGAGTVTAGVVVGICADVGGVEGFGAGALFFLLRLKHEMEKALLETRFTSIQLQLAEKSW